MLSNLILVINDISNQNFKYINLFVIIDPAYRKFTLVSEAITVTTTPHRSQVVIDATVGKSTQFRFEYEGSGIAVNLESPSGATQNVTKENGVNSYVFNSSGLAMVRQ